MEERLVQLLKAEGINPTRFAERIGVQRSSMSHILSGRNKPSYDFLVKVLDSFPAVNPDWLIRGKGLMYKADIPVQPSLFDTPIHRATVIEETSTSRSSEGIKGQGDTKDPNFAKLKSPENPILLGDESKKPKTIEKIVVFYSDKTFSDYHPDF